MRKIRTMRLISFPGKKIENSCDSSRLFQKIFVFCVFRSNPPRDIIIQTISSSIIIIFQYFDKSSLKILGLKCCLFVIFWYLWWLNLGPIVIEFEKKKRIRKRIRGYFNYMVDLNPLVQNWLWIIAQKKGGDIWNDYFPGKFQIFGGKFPGKTIGRLLKW